jgi:uncharacterized protein (DUF488 family)
LYSGREIAGPLVFKYLEMSSFDLFSIGHSNTPADRFIELLRAAGVNAVADLRSTPFSRFFPWFSRKTLEVRLAQAGIAYRWYGEPLGGRPGDPGLYRDGVADYDAMAAQPDYRAGLERLIGDASRHRICIMCAEREPLDCHRCLLVARSLTEQGLAVGHILHDGAIEPHEATEQRLLAWDSAQRDLLEPGQSSRLAAAYGRRARAVAYRAKPKRAGAKSIAEAP